MSQSKYSTKINALWKKEIDNQYEFYLASLRANRDSEYLLQEHRDILNKIETAKKQNVQLRKQIRAFELELYMMYQRNVYDSNVIDGLQEVDHEAKEKNQLKSDYQNKLNIALDEYENQKFQIPMLNQQIVLLNGINQENLTLMNSLGSHGKQVKELLNSEMLRNHQRDALFKRQLKRFLTAFQEIDNRSNILQRDGSAGISWIKEEFNCIIGKDIQQIKPVSELEATSVTSNQETQNFVTETLEENATEATHEEMKEESCRFMASRELLDSQNFTLSCLIYTWLEKIGERIRDLIPEYLLIHEITNEINLIKEHIERLHAVRKKKEDIFKKEPFIVGKIFDDMEMIFKAMVTEEKFLKDIIQYFSFNIKDDFELNSIFLSKTKELFSAALHPS